MIRYFAWSLEIHSNTVWSNIFQFNRSESEFLYNLTTIEPDDETINTLIEAVDTAVTELQNAIGGTTDSSSNYDYEFAPDDVQYPDYIFVDDEDETDFDYSEGLLDRHLLSELGLINYC